MTRRDLYAGHDGGRNCFRCRHEVIVDDGAVFEVLACFLLAKFARFVCDSYANRRRATHDTREDCRTVGDDGQYVAFLRATYVRQPDDVIGNVVLSAIGQALDTPATVTLDPAPVYDVLRLLHDDVARGLEVSLRGFL